MAPARWTLGVAVLVDASVRNQPPLGWTLGTTDLVAIVASLVSDASALAAGHGRPVAVELFLPLLVVQEEFDSIADPSQFFSCTNCYVDLAVAYSVINLATQG